MKLPNTFILLLAILFFLPFNSQAQLKSKKGKRLAKKYQSFLEEGSKLVDVNAYQTVEKIGKQYVRKTYHPDKMVLTQYETFTDKKLKTKTGPYKGWFDNGQQRQTGTYNDSDAEGVWVFYSFNTKKPDKIGSYVDDEKEGKWTSLDSLGRTIKEHHYKAGKLEGDYIRYDTLGNILETIKFADGEEVLKTIVDSLWYNETQANVYEAPIIASCSEEESADAKKKCSDEKYIEFVNGAISYPESARLDGIEGRAFLILVIDEQGDIEKIVVKRGICKEIEEECIAMLRKSPKWIPRKVNGVAKKTHFNVPFKFKFE